MVMEVIRLHQLKQLSLIVVIPFDMFTVVRFEHDEKAEFPMDVKLDGIDSDVSPSQS